MGFLAVRMGIAAYLVPFYFAYRPALLLIGSVADIVHAAVLATLGILAAAMALAGFAFRPLNIVPAGPDGGRGIVPPHGRR